MLCKANAEDEWAAFGLKLLPEKTRWQRGCDLGRWLQRADADHRFELRPIATNQNSVRPRLRGG